MLLRRIFFAPFSLIWFIVTELRNRMFDWGIRKSFQIPNKSICIGNLSLGGTGKTPMTAFLAKMFENDLNVQILSRGYGRKTTGFLKVKETDSAENVGDEPLFYKLKFNKKVSVAVCENRKEGIDNIGKDNFELLLLDDAFQHRKVTAGFNILLTPYNNIFSKDFLVPMGTLRESSRNANRSNCIVITKCPNNIEETEKNKILQELKKFNKPIFFSHIEYHNPIPFGKPIQQITRVILVTGIANPKPLVEFLEKTYQIELVNFPDHHQFKQSEIEQIHRKIDTFADDQTAIFTTEKDFARLNSEIKTWKLENYPWYYVPIEMEFENEIEFKSLINNYVRAI
jgi:tetraacyldisaccharide 4'-kinase